MGEFKLDTSGVVMKTAHGGRVLLGPWMWEHRDPQIGLTPFVQGYMSAEAAGVAELLAEAFGSDWNGTVSFDAWAPETLARIIEDCAAFGQTWRVTEPDRGFAQGADGGRDFWELRQKGFLTDPPFPPLTVSLGDDGKIYLTTPNPIQPPHKGAGQ